MSLMSHRWLFVFAFFKFAILGHVIVPPWSNPDEIGHYSFVSDLAQGEYHHLGSGYLEPEASSSAYGNRSPQLNWILSHPPFYYMAVAPVLAGLDAVGAPVLTKLKALRLVNAVLATLALYLMFRTVLLVSNSLPAAMFAAAIPVFTPMYAALAGSAGHDIAVFMFGSAGAFFLASYFVSKRPQSEIMCLAMFACAALVKSTGLPIFAGVAAVFLAIRIFERRLNAQAIAAGAVIALCVFVWHLYTYLSFGQWILYPGRPVPALTSAEFSFLTFLTTIPVVETALSTFSGFIWVSRGPDIHASVSFPQGALLHGFLMLLTLLLAAVSRSLLFQEGWPFANRRYRPPTLFASAALALVIGLSVASTSTAGHVVVGLLSFIGLFSIMNAFRILTEKDEAVRFCLLAFSACFCLFVVTMYSFYQIYLERGEAGALHGRYIYSVAPMLLIALATAIARKSFARPIFLGLLTGFVWFDAIYWTKLALPIYTVIDTF